VFCNSNMIQLIFPYCTGNYNFFHHFLTFLLYLILKHSSLTFVMLVLLFFSPVRLKWTVTQISAYWWLLYPQHTDHYINPSLSEGRAIQDFIMLLGTMWNLEWMVYFWKFLSNIFGLWLTTMENSWKTINITELII
jgi:hypothetical protein